MKKKDEILHRAIDLIKEKGDLGWSYEDIATFVGIRKASVHYHFPKKEDLIEEAARVYIAQVNSEVQRGIRQARNFREKLLAVAYPYRQIFCQKERLCLVVSLSLSLAERSPGLAEVLGDFLKGVHLTLCGILEDAKVSGEVDVENVEAVATTILALFQGLLIVGEYGWSQKQFDEVIQQVLALLSR